MAQRAVYVAKVKCPTLASRQARKLREYDPPTAVTGRLLAGLLAVSEGELSVIAAAVAGCGWVAGDSSLDFHVPELGVGIHVEPGGAGQWPN